MPISIKVFEKTPDSNQKVLFESDVNRSFRIGRQEDDEPEVVRLIEVSDPVSRLDLKLVIASANEREYSRRFAEILLSNDRIEVKNTSANQSIFSGASTPIHPHESRIVLAPFELTLGNRTISFVPANPAFSDLDLRSLPAFAPPNLLALKPTDYASSIDLMKPRQGDSIGGERLLELLQITMQILQNSPNSPEFFDNAARTIAQILDLDHILIAFDTPHAPTFGKETATWGRWRAQSLFTSGQRTDEWSPSTKILDFVHREKQTVYQIPDVRTMSLMNVKSLVASPLKNARDDVIGVIYGDRGMLANSESGFRQTEAMFVELFANGISVGLERMGQERQISQMRARFDQFFSPRLARQIESDMTMLEPRSAQVSVLFADIRGFSRIAERIGPDKSIKWINFVLSRLSDCVFNHEGVVVDYVGDEVMAMWGAPEVRADHAELAVRAALEMISHLPEINRQWVATVGEPVDFGIGINSGEAQVGNTGSERKFKYGPLGDVVNVSSRIQGATKQLRANLLVAESTCSQLPAELIRRKIRSVRFVNVKRAVTVYEVPFRPDDDWKALQGEYEKGLEFYEQGDHALASQQMASVVNKWKADGPSMLLLSDSVKWLQLNSEDFDPVWQLVQK